MSIKWTTTECGDENDKLSMSRLFTLSLSKDSKQYTADSGKFVQIIIVCLCTQYIHVFTINLLISHQKNIKYFSHNWIGTLEKLLVCYKEKWL